MHWVATSPTLAFHTDYQTKRVTSILVDQEAPPIPVRFACRSPAHGHQA